MADLEADFLAIYRIEDIEALSGPKFLSLALRVAAYQGVIAARLADQQGVSNGNGGEVRRVESTKTQVTGDPVLGSLVSWGGG